jgi:hypothetical protein
MGKMTDAEYFDAVLDEQKLQEDSGELKDLRRQREKVEKLLRKKFGSGPTIRYGGSKAKGTMNRDSFDMDLTFYLPEDDTSAGATLQEIYENVETALREEYWTERKGSAIRLRSRDELRTDFHIDVVPGRFVDGNNGDVHLYRTGGDKHYLKTNLDVHIAHVRDSKVVPAIRLLKLWACRNHVGIKTFALELLTIKLLEGRKSLELSEQLKHVLTQFRDDAHDLCIEDPANPHGNDLSELLSDGVRIALETTARNTLNQVEQNGWEAVFGPLKDTEKAKKVAALKRMAAAAPVRPKPYGID